MRVTIAWSKRNSERANNTTIIHLVQGSSDDTTQSLWHRAARRDDVTRVWGAGGEPRSSPPVRASHQRWQRDQERNCRRGPSHTQSFPHLQKGRWANTTSGWAPVEYRSASDFFLCVCVCVCRLDGLVGWWTVRDVQPRMATLVFTQLLGSVIDGLSSVFYIHRDCTDY